ncbi:ABC transporter permease [Oceanispirochaeta sp.]|jgi:ribose/xylose/arabinose/galactoside ABC-type transport system permease subunit|uniref:ABC transporter permease n=1 Tax=Oceanispirochaeta sp. TaxID=2035350 RepID=UPI00263978DA|nr:ABC transporter permease [Oceanispirochaeta sp.]MDA3958634.1 ABC transporter permease [Oceanispirochaeta sp.]
MVDLTAFTKKKIFWPLVALGVLMLFNLFFTPNFFRLEIKDGHLYGNLIDIIKNAAPIMLMAIGLTLVIATKGIDISVGSIVAISAGVVAMMIGSGTTPQFPFAVAIGAALLVSVLAGAWNGMLVSRLGMQPIIATLILLVAGRGIAMVTTNAMIIWLYARPFAIIGQGYFLGLPFSIYIVAVLLFITTVVTRRTALGLFIESVGINRTAARFTGINAKNILLGVYMFSAFAAGMAGIVVCSTVMSADGNNAGDGYEMSAILAVVLGGTSLNGGKFYLYGSMVGALIVQTLTTTIYAFGVPPEISKIVIAAVVICVSLLQSRKFRSLFMQMFGKRAVQE